MYISTSYKKNKFGETTLTMVLSQSQRVDGKPTTSKKHVGTIIATDFLEGDWKHLNKMIDFRLTDEEQKIFRAKLPREVAKVKHKLGMDLTEEERTLLQK